MSEFKIGDRVEVFGRRPVPGLEDNFSGKGYVDRVDEGVTKLTYRVCFDERVPPGWWVFNGQLRREGTLTFSPGDLVELKSHSVAMTVVSVVGESVSVIYAQYGGNGFMDHGGPRIVERTFPLAVLKKSEPVGQGGGFRAALKAPEAK